MKTSLIVVGNRTVVKGTFKHFGFYLRFLKKILKWKFSLVLWSIDGSSKLLGYLIKRSFKNFHVEEIYLETYFKHLCLVTPILLALEHYTAMFVFYCFIILTVHHVFTHS